MSEVDQVTGTAISNFFKQQDEMIISEIKRLADEGYLRIFVLDVTTEKVGNYIQVKGGVKIDTPKYNDLLYKFNKANAKIKELEAKLSIAVEALELLEKYKAYNGDDWVSLESRQALEKLRGEKW